MPIDNDKMRETIIKAVSEKIGIPLEYIRDTDMDGYVCHDAKGFTYLITGNLCLARMVYMVRSVGRGWKRYGSRIETIVGGQVTRGKQVGRWSEGPDNTFHIPVDDFYTPAFYELGGEHLRTAAQQTVPVV